MASTDVGFLARLRRAQNDIPLKPLDKARIEMELRRRRAVDAPGGKSKGCSQKTSG
jgi:hypothetical protein